MKTTLLLCSALLMSLNAQAQTWQPSARIWGARTDNIVWDIAGHPPLMPMFKGPNGSDSIGQIYSLINFNVNSEPIGFVPHFRQTRMVGDVNGDGKNDLAGKSWDREEVVVLSPYTDEAVELPFYNQGAIHGGWLNENALEDCDGDGINDVMDVRGRNPGEGLSVSITYGAADGVWKEQSLVQWYEGRGVGKFDGEDRSDKLICVGTISGKPCLLKAVYDKVAKDEFKVYYKLDVFNQDDLRERRDTVRSTTVQVYDSPVGAAFQGFLIEFEDTWFAMAIPGAPHALRVTLDGIEPIDTPPSFVGHRGQGIFATNCYGQGRSVGTQFVRVDGNRPFMVYSKTRRQDSVKELHMEAHRFMFEGSLESELLGVMNLALSTHEPIDIGGMQDASLTPDLDGDGIEDAIIHYKSLNPNTEKDDWVIDLFLTGDRPTVSVTENPKPLIETTCTFTNFEPAMIYNVLGKQVAVVHVENETIAPSQLEALPQGALWAVQGECVRRVR